MDTIESVAEAILRDNIERRGSDCINLRGGILISFEGLDGSGVTTHAKILYRVLKEMDPCNKVFYTKEPTVSPIGLLIWQILKGYLPEEFKQPDILALLFTADRVYHFYSDPTFKRYKGIMQALQDGAIVIVDRYVFSMLAYQSVVTPGSRKITGTTLGALIRLTPLPDIVVYIDVDPEESLQRIIRREEQHLYETLDRLQQVRQNYVRYLAALSTRIRYIDPDGDAEPPPDWARAMRSSTISRLGEVTRAVSWSASPCNSGDPSDWCYNVPRSFGKRSTRPFTVVVKERELGKTARAVFNAVTTLPMVGLRLNLWPEPAAPKQAVHGPEVEDTVDSQDGYQ